MARYGPERKGETRRRVLREAGRALREQGPVAATIPGIMGRAGLTQGAFYAHFESKEALLAEAAAEALAGASRHLLARGEEAPQGAGLAAVVEHYLSPDHRDDLSDGCPLPAFSGDALRGNAAGRRAYTEALTDFLAGLAKLAPPRSGHTKDDAELALVSTMVGGLLLARAVDDPRLSDRILAAARSLCLSTLAVDAE